jgi:hypothetical protein
MRLLLLAVLAFAAPSVTAQTAPMDDARIHSAAGCPQPTDGPEGVPGPFEERTLEVRRLVGLRCGTPPSGDRQTPSGGVLAELRRENWGGTTWEPSVRSRYTYDGQGGATERLAEVWTGSSWVNASRDLYAYDAAELLVLEIAQDWVDETWWDFQREIYAYEEGLEVEYVRRDCAGSSCENAIRKLYAYGSGDLLVEFVLQRWEETEWQVLYRELFDYEADGLRTEQLRQGWIDGAWTDLWRVRYAYDSGLLVESVREYSNGAGWDAQYRDSYAYEGEFLVGTLSEHWDGSGWENTLRLLYAFDSDGLRAERVRQLWVEDEWENDTRSLYAHDDGLQTEETRQEWEGNAWRNTTRFLYTYASPTDAEEVTPEPALFSVAVYPNPASARAAVEVTSHRAAYVKVEVADVLGRRVTMLHEGVLTEGVHTFGLDEALPAGVYLVRVTGGKTDGTHRFTVVR